MQRKLPDIWKRAWVELVCSKAVQTEIRMKQEKQPEGKVLRVKMGYNPNSSSVGSNIPAFLAFAVGSGAINVIALQILGGISRRIRKGKDCLTRKNQE